MPLESVVICVDTTSFMRNGDYPPSRIDTQLDAVTMTIMRRLEDNPETTVGVISYGNKGVRLLNSLTEDEGKLLGSLHGLTPDGEGFHASAIKTAILALKHRKKRVGGQRIMMFIGSPVDATESELKAIAATLKKNNIAIDVILMGENDVNEAKITEFVNQASKTVDNAPNSHTLIVPIGDLPSNALFASDFFTSNNMGGGGGNNFAEYGGIDPNMDPELAMALRLSLEESQRASSAMETSENNDNTSSTAPAPAPPSAATAADSADMFNVDVDGMDPELAEALRMSLLESTETPAAPAESTEAPVSTTSSGGPLEGIDQATLNEILESLPGVDVNDPAIQDLIKDIAAEKKRSGE